MKLYPLVTLIYFFLTGLTIFAQDMNLEIRGVNTRTTTLSTLEQASSISDINPDHGSSWISSYESVEVGIQSSSEIKKIVGASEEFSTAQKLLFGEASINDEVVINITYIPKNALSKSSTRSLRYSYTIVPDQEAEFPGGDKALYTFLNEKIARPILTNDKEEVDLTIVSFSINESGEVMEASIQQPSNNRDFDQALLGTIKSMPQWQAAMDASGTKVVQSFQLSIGYLVGC